MCVVLFAYVHLISEHPERSLNFHSLKIFLVSLLLKLLHIYDVFPSSIESVPEKMCFNELTSRVKKSWVKIRFF